MDVEPGGGEDGERRAGDWAAPGDLGGPADPPRVLPRGIDDLP